MEKIFKALADSSRREILDIVKNKPGITINEITEHFEFSRFAVMKHIKILEDADLIVPQKEGKFKKLYLNAVPIQMISDRWISQFSKLWAKNLTSLKYKLEEETKMSEQELKHVFVTYIKTTKEKLWEAITKGELTNKYFYDTSVKSDFTVGSKIEYWGVNKEGKEYTPVYGEILEIIPNEKLIHTFTHKENQDSPSRVEYQLEEVDGNIKLTLIHDKFGDDIESYNSVQQGWPYILSGLKTYLETNTTLK